jgi:hypothetical protein
VARCATSASSVVGTVKFEARIRELVVDHLDLAAITEPLLIARRVLREQLDVLHRRLLAVVRHDEVCRRLMTVPGVGPVVALTFRATVDVPARFKNSKAVGAVFGLTPRRHQSGEIDRMGSISKCGDAMIRTMLFGPGHADPHHQVVVAQGLGHEDRSPSGNEEGNRRRGTANGGYHAPHVGRRYRVPLGKCQRRSCLSGTRRN